MNRAELLKIAKPILFNTEMVQAILDGRKTVTRRVIKPHNSVKSSRMGGYYQGNGLWIDTDINNGDSKGHIKDYSVSCTWWTINEYIKRLAPYKIGDILRVKETYRTDAYVDGRIEYRASPTCEEKVEEYDRAPQWRPSVHMPKEATRIFLKVTDVRVERLQEINIDQLNKEGFGNVGHPVDKPWYKVAYEKIKQVLNCKDDDWVWVIEFERVEVEEC